jgi:hypothetical protein
MNGSHDEMDVAPGPADPTRRAFLKAATIGAVGAAAVTTGVVTIWSMREGASGQPRTYAFVHGRDIALWIGNGDRFTIKVLRGREVIEEHTGVTAGRIDELESQFFASRFIPVPTAA